MEPGVRFQPGDLILSRYFVEETRRGGMGIVYLCVDRASHKPVAIKTFEDRYLDSERNRKKFLEEACTWIELGSHPNIVRAYSVFLIDEKPYLLIERVASQQYRGATLKDYIYSNPITEQDILQIGIHICDGMLYAQRKFPGFVHRDLKTENILITQEGEPKISDFGLTLRQNPHEENDDIDNSFTLPSRDNSLDLARLVQCLEGAPAYASPEQCLGKSLDTRSDIYSFGIILYALVVKSPPFHRSTVEETLLAHLSETPIEPIRKNPAIQPSLSKLIMDCLEKEPNRRVSSFAVARNRLIGIYMDAYEGSPLTYTRGEPLSAEEYFDQGVSFEKLGEWSRAERALQLAIDCKTDWVDPYVAIARVYFEQGNATKALEQLDLALFYDPKHSEAYELKANIFSRQYYWEEAENCFRRAIELNPTKTVLYHRIADLFMRNGRFEEAETYLRSGIKNGGEPMMLYRSLAHLYRKYGGKQNELDAVKQMLKQNPDDIDLLLRAAELSLYLRDMISSRKWTNSVLSADPQEPEALFRLGFLLLKMNNKAKAYEALKRAYFLGFQNGDLFLELAKIEMDRGDHNTAWNMLLQAEEHGVEADRLKRTIQAKRFRESFGKR